MLECEQACWHFNMHAPVLTLCLCGPQDRKMAPLVADTALKLAISVQKLGKFATTMQNKSGFNKDRSDWWLLLVAAMKHCGVLGTVVSVLACEH